MTTMLMTRDRRTCSLDTFPLPSKNIKPPLCLRSFEADNHRNDSYQSCPLVDRQPSMSRIIQRSDSSSNLFSYGYGHSVFLPPSLRSGSGSESGSGSGSGQNSFTSKHHRRAVSLPAAPQDFKVKCVSFKPMMDFNTNPNFNPNSSDPSKTLNLVELVATEKWYDVVQRAQKYPAEAGKEISVKIRGENSKCFPIHWACIKKAPFQVIEILVKASPKSLLISDSLHSATPLALACSFGATSEVIHLLISASPEALKKYDRDGNLPCHIACSRRCESIISLLLSAYPGAAKVKNFKHKVPLMLAVSRYDSLSSCAIKELLMANAEAAELKDMQNRTTLHFAVMWKASAEVIDLLIASNKEALYMRDLSHHTPYHLGKLVCRLDDNHPTLVTLRLAMLSTKKISVKIETFIEIVLMTRKKNLWKSFDTRKLRNMKYG